MMARSQSCQDLGFRVASESALELMGPRVLAGVLNAKNLQGGIEEFARLIKNENSGMFVWTSQRGNSVRINFKVSFEPKMPGFRHAEWQCIVILLTVIRFYAGKNWTPDQLSTRSATAPSASTGGPFEGTQILSNQRSACVVVRKALLSSCLSSYGKAVKAELSNSDEGLPSETPAASFGESLQRVLRAHLPAGRISLSAAAEITGLSSRSLQRRLAEEGVTFSQLLDLALLNIASTLLVKTKASSLEIAFKTGFEDASHFARTFKRLAGCSPQEYRRRQVADKRHGRDPSSVPCKHHPLFVDASCSLDDSPREYRRRLAPASSPPQESEACKKISCRATNVVAKWPALSRASV